ncbi:MAG TPA: DUF4372 domain-containing protein [Bacteroidetes bacterium]|nr:DUF4372 domain-containing protein [Bacteroidota bacterium]
MSKNTEIKFIGQPIFKQILNLADAVNIQSLVRKHNSDYYYKAYKSRTHLCIRQGIQRLPPVCCVGPSAGILFHPAKEECCLYGH